VRRFLFFAFAAALRAEAAARRESGVGAALLNFRAHTWPSKRSTAIRQGAASRSMAHKAGTIKL
jgi:hypothetical protein